MLFNVNIPAPAANAVLIASRRDNFFMIASVAIVVRISPFENGLRDLVLPGYLDELAERRFRIVLSRYLAASDRGVRPSFTGRSGSARYFRSSLIGEASYFFRTA